ncbi:uncharacterized protein LAESUDRAFT_662566, partial [Laetiporus sulphureus 93-53]
RQYLTCNMTVNASFYGQGQAMRNNMSLLPELINSGMRLLAHAGNTGSWDPLSHYGIERWMQRLEHNFHTQFAKSPSIRWTTMESGRYRRGGTDRCFEVLKTENVTFVQVYDARYDSAFFQPGR